MKATVFFGCTVIFLAAAVFAFPQPANRDAEDETDAGDYKLGIQGIDFPERSPGIRHKRATCDLLSASTKFGSLNHSACAAHCLVLMRGFRGGYCDKGVCHCRK